LIPAYLVASDVFNIIKESPILTTEPVIVCKNPILAD
jgi:hypothetical protein